MSDRGRRRGLLQGLLYGNFGALVIDGQLEVSPELELEFAAERQAEAAAAREAQEIPAQRRS